MAGVTMRIDAAAGQRRQPLLPVLDLLCQVLCMRPRRTKRFGNKTSLPRLVPLSML